MQYKLINIINISMDYKRFRHDYKMSQTELADILGCKQSNISSIESSTKPASQLNIRLLIEKYGYDVISKYATPEEMPAQVTINMPKVSTNQGQINGGGGNSMNTVDASLVSALNEALKLSTKSQDQLSTSQEQLTKAQEQIDRLITLLENQQNRG